MRKPSQALGVTLVAEGGWSQGLGGGLCHLTDALIHVALWGMGQAGLGGEEDELGKLGGGRGLLTNCPAGWAAFLHTCLVPQEVRTVTSGCQAGRLMGYKLLVSSLQVLLKDSLQDSGQVPSSIKQLPENSQ